MDIQSLKLNLVQKILNTEKPSLLSKIDRIFQREEKNDWWEQLPIEIRDSIMEGIDDIQKGNTFSHDQVIQEAKQKYGF
ncbi:MAG: hypothetical protein A2W90_16560 [Bacteroidetes bacterium GWF2_42_66]|nr:MAG: hypothetical protein A2W92_04055 [Bacteroidetes bacterium GWA2_42_15]OFX96306.1 MAG: hypothetical protein A2W89_05490 [Bacteroidetes bacterium GWE2_42_39]OFY46345.1 MAG: hypothetical protein A2W90_16560 [Bacteroidetes bacterium GWF2_42_66]HAZ03467.1 hypothetical protein [Marinilabiliales bacterium]HBL78269.1 hypothetical protein [Prolixibacteraceae bacterium]